MESLGECIQNEAVFLRVCMYVQSSTEVDVGNSIFQMHLGLSIAVDPV